MDLPVNLPSENVDILFSNLEFCELMKFRLVSKNWSSLISRFSSRKNSLAFVGPDRYCKCLEVPGRAGHKPFAVTLDDHFFGAVKVGKFLRIKDENSPLTLNHDRTQFILNMFPNIEHLALIGGRIDPSCTPTSLAALMFRWTKLSTLCLAIPINDGDQIVIAAAMNQLTNLIRLDLTKEFDVSLLHPTLWARLHHLSLGFHAEDVRICDVFRHIGPDFRRLWLYPGEVSVTVLRSWMSANVRLFNNLTHFGCSSFHLEDEVLKFIDSHFMSLTVWHIADVHAGHFSRMGLVSRLNELRVLDAHCYIPHVPLESDAKQMKNVHTFEFRWNGLHDDDDPERMAKEFCTRLAWLLPNVKRLIIVFPQSSTLHYIRANLSLFTNLLTHELREGDYRSHGY